MGQRRRGVTTKQRIERLVFEDGSFLEGTIAQFDPTEQHPEGVDYRLAYVAADGSLLILYDNQGEAILHTGTRRRRGSPIAFPTLPDWSTTSSTT